MATKSKGLACPVTLGYPDPGSYELVVERKKENAARKKAEQSVSFCLLLGVEIPQTRIRNTKWCLCGSCMPFKTIHENICCREVLQTEVEEPTCSGQLDAVEGLKEKLKDCKRCIVQHPSFEKEVLDEETLSAKIKETRAGEKRRRVREDQNMVFRYYAYRSFILWAYGPMGMREPFELPACVRAAIMSKFSLDGEKPSASKALTKAKKAERKPNKVLTRNAQLGRKRVKKEAPKKEALECDEEEWREESI